MEPHYLTRLREMRPRVHCITNYVTAHDCANLLLAAGAQPVMADDPMESAEITAASDALVLNLGIPNQAKLEAMILSGRKANEQGIPVVFDPVGAAASAMRRDAAARLLSRVRMTMIHGNASEISMLAGESTASSGVDALPGDVDEKEVSGIVKRLAEKTGAVVLLSGKTDVVSDGRRCALIRSGHSIMSRITGTGCQLSALMGAFAAASPDDPFGAALGAACMMGLCGEIAAARMTPQDGNASCAEYIIDAAFRMDENTLREGAGYEQG